MKQIKGIMANRYAEILKRIEKGENVDLNTVLSEWQGERDEIGTRIIAKLHFLYGELYKAQTQLEKSESHV